MRKNYVNSLAIFYQFVSGEHSRIEIQDGTRLLGTVAISNVTRSQGSFQEVGENGKKPSPLPIVIINFIIPLVSSNFLMRDN